LKAVDIRSVGGVSIHSGMMTGGGVVMLWSGVRSRDEMKYAPRILVGWDCPLFLACVPYE
jgi:hypothetical protein